MPGPCYYHPDTPATGTCIQCGMPICNADTEVIGGKTVCKKCVSVVRARVERELASQPAAAPMGNSGNWSPPSAAQSDNYGNPNSYYAPADTADSGKLAIGIGVSLVIGIVSAIVIEKILISTGFGLSLLYIFMGYGIGYGLHALTGQGGPKMAAIAVGVMLISLIVSHLVLVQDFMNQVAKNHPGEEMPPFSYAIAPVLTQLGFMHWVLIAIGLYSCFQGMMRRQ